MIHCCKGLQKVYHSFLLKRKDPQCLGEFFPQKDLLPEPNDLLLEPIGNGCHYHVFKLRVDSRLFKNGKKDLISAVFKVPNRIYYHWPISSYDQKCEEEAAATATRFFESCQSFGNRVQATSIGPFILCSFVDGKTLKYHIEHEKTRHIPIEEAILDLILRASKSGVIIKDPNPANIIISPDMQHADLVDGEISQENLPYREALEGNIMSFTEKLHTNHLLNNFEKTLKQQLIGGGHGSNIPWLNYESALNLQHLSRRIHRLQDSTSDLDFIDRSLDIWEKV